MNALKDLLDGAHGLLAIVVLIAGTVFVIVGKMSVDAWVDLAKWVLGIFSGTHAVMSLRGNARSKAGDLPKATALPPTP